MIGKESNSNLVNTGGRQLYALIDHDNILVISGTIEVTKVILNRERKDRDTLKNIGKIIGTGLEVQASTTTEESRRCKHRPKPPPTIMPITSF